MPKVQRLIAVAAGVFGLVLLPTTLPALELTSFDADPSKAADANASMQLILEPDTDRDGQFRGVLLIELEPGWKTYWLDPGDGGIPPSFDFFSSLNIAQTDIRYPAPTRFSDGYGQYNGYVESLAVAFVFQKIDRAAPSTVNVSAMLGVCKKICIPFSADLSARTSISLDPTGTQAIERGFATLPDRLDYEKLEARFEPAREMLVMTFEDQPLAGTEGLDLFVDGSDGWYFGAPKSFEIRDSRLTALLPVLERPADGFTSPPTVYAVLKTPNGNTEAVDVPVQGPNVEGSRTDSRADKQ